jgi:choline dehydrogenase-like flavoprotein
VTGLVCDWGGRRLRLEARLFVLAAGALSTPAILLQSVSSRWPNGVANGSGLVGRNLMRHFVDLYALAAPVSPRTGDNVKELGCNDFYLFQGEKLGTFQSFGWLPPTSIIAQSLEDDIRHAAGRAAAFGFRLMKPLVRFGLQRDLSRRVVMVTTLEDLPYRENRVEIANGRLAVTYRLSAHAQARIRRFRAIMKGTLDPIKYRLIQQAENNERLAHVCGTCRMGVEPSSSVVDADCRAHELENLYIGDASVFPTSGGINPSLTIAANALRVADGIATGLGLPGLSAASDQ